MADGKPGRPKGSAEPQYTCYHCGSNDTKEQYQKDNKSYNRCYNKPCQKAFIIYPKLNWSIPSAKERRIRVMDIVIEYMNRKAA